MPSAQSAQIAIETARKFSHDTHRAASAPRLEPAGRPETSVASCCRRLDQLAIRSAAARAAYADQGRTVLIKAGPFAKVPALPFLLLCSLPYIMPTRAAPS